MKSVMIMDMGMLHSTNHVHKNNGIINQERKTNYIHSTDDDLQNITKTTVTPVIKQGHKQKQQK